jgi:hypothetical protein
MSITKEQLVEAIKASYRRLQYSEGPIRCQVETDALIEQLARMVPPTLAQVEQVGNAYIQERNSGFGPIINRCLGCDQTFRSEHGAKFHQCSATAVTQRWTDTQ